MAFQKQNFLGYWVPRLKKMHSISNFRKNNIQEFTGDAVMGELDEVRVMGMMYWDYICILGDGQLMHLDRCGSKHTTWASPFYP